MKSLAQTSQEAIAGVLVDAPNYIVHTETGEIISPTDLLPGVAADAHSAFAPSIDDIQRVLDRSLVKWLAQKYRFLTLV